MKQLLTFLLVALIALSINSCKKVSGTGAVITETRSPGAFSFIDSEIPGDVEIQQGAVQDLTVSAQANVMDAIQTEVSNGRLSIKIKKGVILSNNTEVKISITLPTIEGLTLSGSGDMEAENDISGTNIALQLTGSGNLSLKNLTANSLNSELTGSGNITIDGGTTQSFTLNLSGSGNFDAPNLEAQDASVTITGSGNATIKVINHLNAVISGSGDIDYYGNPTIQQTITGSGSINHKG